MIDLTAPIRRDANKCAHTAFCHEHPDGSLTLTVGLSEQLLEACDLAPGAQFAVTLQRLKANRWFTPEVQCDFTNVVASNWLAKAKGWR